MKTRIQTENSAKRQFYRISINIKWKLKFNPRILQKDNFTEDSIKITWKLKIWPENSATQAENSTQEFY